MKNKANKKGFTIMEMLIVVAIIAVLAAILIPTFNGALTKAKEATDVANIRAAYAEVMVDYLTNDADFPTTADAAKTAITAKIDGGEAALSYKDSLTVTKSDTTGAYNITYTAKKLTAKDGTKVFAWKLAPFEIK